MKTGKLALAFLTCASGSVFAQGGSPECVKTNYDPAQHMFTVINPAPGAVNQQCFLTVLPPGAARPAGLEGSFVEGTYEIVLSGGGGAGGGGGGNKEHPEQALGGKGGNGALPVHQTTYLSAGVYRLTIGTGGKAGDAAMTEGSGGSGSDGNPTSISEAYSGKTIAGFPRAQYWAGSESYEVVTGRGFPSLTKVAYSGEGPGVINGSDGQNLGGTSHPGTDGGNGFIKMTLVAQATPPAPTPPAAAPAPAPKPVVRPKRMDRN